MIIWISENRIIITTTAQWKINDSDDFLAVLREHHDAKTSSEAAFIGECGHPSKYGLKIFYHRQIAQYTYHKQKTLAKLGLSPLVGHHGLIRVSILSRENVCHSWGFLTEIVDYSHSVYYGENRKFFERLTSIGADRDACGNNVGWDRRGRPVLCDTGTHSFYSNNVCETL